jgi:hypothetical protein
MSGAIVGFATFALCYAGLSGLCFAMSRHDRHMWHRSPSAVRSRMLRMGGWLLLGLSLVACIRVWGASVGFVMWFGLISAAAALIVFLLPYAPRAVYRGAVAAAPCGLLLMAIAG